MMIEQQGLFGEEEPAEKQAGNPVVQESLADIPFLPGIKFEEAYPDVKDLDMLGKKALGCRGCRLRETCQQVVFSAGSADAKIIFIGEGPGSDEDEQGVPFVGRAGQLLNQILAAAELKREEVYITNVVKCRPPGNRLPNPDEVKVCRSYLEAEIRIIKPHIIVCLGAMATQTVVDPKARIGQLRGRWLQRNGIRIMPTYHPAALLRNPSYKRPVWEDFKLIRDVYKTLT
ncbi:MAG TPA: uracil-DNA glycosylase [Syntrophomonas sp.]|nr:uracil-DNA glycosylase [Syntrophomonas sp.]HRW11515.1 uracil-DNA glycosylase [Syntrophomonas sp.]